MANRRESYTPTPTSTPTPTTHYKDFLSELQTRTPTHTPTPLGLEVFAIIDHDTFCYYSPDSNYAAAHSLLAGTEVELVGYSEDLSYMAVISPRNPSLTCYVDKLYLTLPDPLPDLQVLVDPPPPIDPSAGDSPGEPQACYSGLSQAACSAAGGKWNISTASCDCP